MLDNQGQAFSGQERLTAMTLGLASVADRVASLLAIPRADGKTQELAQSPSHPLAFALLGMISLRRTLWATLSVQPPRPAAPPVASEQSASPRAGLLR